MRPRAAALQCASSSGYDQLSQSTNPVRYHCVTSFSGTGVNTVLTINLPHLLDELDRREVALWVRGTQLEPEITNDTLAGLLRLPWRLVLAESIPREVLKLLAASEDASNPLVSKRGFVQLVEDRPSQIELPKRCLPIYLLNQVELHADIEMQAKRLEMLMLLASSQVRRLVVVSLEDEGVPPELEEVWKSGLRSYLSLVSTVADAAVRVEEWSTDVVGNRPIVSVYDGAPEEFAAELTEAFFRVYAEDSARVRLRGEDGRTISLDVLSLDNPDNPILDNFTIIQETDLLPLQPQDITADEVEGFFIDPSKSWRPYAAGLVWPRTVDGDCELKELLANLDVGGSEENCIAYVACESGAGGTTLARNLAWTYAQEGYPVLVAGAPPALSDALRLSNFMKRVYEETKLTRLGDVAPGDATRTLRKPYETPWIIVVDAGSGDHRGADLRRFLGELREDGRPACILLVGPPQGGLTYLSPEYRKVGELGHTVSEEEALALGRHLNRFLAQFDNARSEAQWRAFYRGHTADELGGIAAFWVVLSFWLRWQFDLTETFQAVVYRTFRESTARKDIRRALVYIAAMSAERRPLPHALLPDSEDGWPVYQHLEDERPNLGALGLVRIGREEGGWILVHDVLGRLLLNAVHQDQRMIRDLGIQPGEDAVHLRLLVLSEIAKKPELGYSAHRDLGDHFATSTFKIDPDHGKGEFFTWWRDVLDVLNEMPSGLRQSSRIFLHHTSVSRRRIAKFDPEVTGLLVDERAELLYEAIRDIRTGLENIEYRVGSESDLNLFNSLAHAYMDAAEVEESRAADPVVVAELREKAKDAVNQAYRISPTNSFAIETFVRNLLLDAEGGGQIGVTNCTQALGILFGAITSNEETYRQAKLDRLARKAVQILMRQQPTTRVSNVPTSAVDVLVGAWVTLCADMDIDEFSLEEVPHENLIRAIEVLSADVGRDNLQVIRLLYELISICFPEDFARQLECLEPLQGLYGSDSLQERLEYAILLYQIGRARDGDRVFGELRLMWRRGEHFVQVPHRLRVLRSENRMPRVVQASVMGDWVGRPMAQVRELRNCKAAFRPEEFGTRELVPGRRFSCIVSFGLNGPFLRPVTARVT